jgi:thiamine-monophosphate kinase
MAKVRETRLGDLSEDRFLKLLLADLPQGRNVVTGPGDDCAVVRCPGGRELQLLKTDCVVEGVHYLREHGPERVGWKALCRAISDIAAMGGEPVHALVTIFSPPEMAVSYWQNVYRGMTKAARRFSISLVGGETTRAQFAALSVTLTGRVEARRLILRSGGQPGDVLFVSGSLGGSIAGRHLDFVPRLAEGRWLGAQGYARAMMDLSDGLATDLPRLAAASGCGFELDTAAVPKTRSCDLERALTDGEDYELLFATPARLADRLLRGWESAFPRVRLSAIGRLTEPGTSSTALPLGFDHFFQLPPTPGTGNEKAR